MTTSEKLADLLVQATTEKSHYYVASVCREAIDEIRILKEIIAQQTKTISRMDAALIDKGVNFDFSKT